MPVTVFLRDPSGAEQAVDVANATEWTFGPTGQLTLVDDGRVDVAVFAAGAWVYALTESGRITP
jgi:hypothetical protein